MTKLTQTERNKNYAHEMNSKGFFRSGFWIHVDDKERVTKYIRNLRNKREKS